MRGGVCEGRGRGREERFAQHLPSEGPLPPSSHEAPSSPLLTLPPPPSDNVLCALVAHAEPLHFFVVI